MVRTEGHGRVCGRRVHSPLSGQGVARRGLLRAGSQHGQHVGLARARAAHHQPAVLHPCRCPCACTVLCSFQTLPGSTLAPGV